MSENLVNRIAPELADTTKILEPVRVTVLPGTFRAGADGRTGNMICSLAVNDKGQLPVKPSGTATTEQEHQREIEALKERPKMIVFASQKYFTEIVEKTGKEEEGGITILLPPILPDMSGQYWIRKLPSYLFASSK
ncbi:MAG: hypothetical protein ACFFCI_00630 [Promethearchaeota archaeon]